MRMRFECSSRRIRKKGFLDLDLDPSWTSCRKLNGWKRKKCHYPGAFLPGAGYPGRGRLYRRQPGLAQQAERPGQTWSCSPAYTLWPKQQRSSIRLKKVVIPDFHASCSLSDSCPPSFEQFKQKHPDHIVISYINCSAGIKALSDIICTSSNAQKLESLPRARKSFCPG